MDPIYLIDSTLDNEEYTSNISNIFKLYFIIY